MKCNITPQVLQEHGFKYQSAGISGADMWQGMAWWDNKELQLSLRGNTSTARPQALCIAGHFNSRIETAEQLETLMEIFGWKRTS